MGKSCRVSVLKFALTLGTLTMLAGFTFAQTAAQKDISQGNWPQFRGAYASGVADGFPTPTKWDVEKSVNVLWKTPIPGLGHSSPVLWGDKIFITTAISGKAKDPLKVGLYGDITPVEDDTSHQFKVYCLDKNTGKILWEKVAATGVPKIKRHPKSTNANPSVATDGKRIVAFFGSEGMYCYDLQGNLQWKKDLGVLDAGYYQVPDAQWGYASSPVIYDGSVIVQADVQQNAFLASFSLKDGKEQWRTKRDDVPTFGTPTIAEVNGRATIIVNGWKHIGGYDAETGLELWKLRGGGDIPAPTPVVAGNLAYVTNAHGSMSPIYAIKLDSAGDISLKGDDTENAGVAWSSRRDGSYMPTPLVYGDYLYICRDNGIAVCFEAKTGKKVYEERLGTGRSGFTASVIAGDGKIYFTSEDGDIYVVKSGPKFELLATNPMGEVCMATPALSAGTLYYRTQSHLIALRETPVKKSAR